MIQLPKFASVHDTVTHLSICLSGTRQIQDNIGYIFLKIIPNTNRVVTVLVAFINKQDQENKSDGVICGSI